ncbi:MAG: alpha-amylase [Chlorobia bacterium]|nr:alpha-amylase [Fimbriimonadaceae bacterium]
MLSLLLALSMSPKSYIPEPSRVVVYEANLRALGPKVGFQALANRLDSIKQLGVNVLWIMPVQPVGKVKLAGGLGSPYAVADFDAINPEFGTANDFRRLVDSAHKRGIAVLIDWVPNHTAWDHPWVKAHPDWYTKDAAGNITIPAGTNWQDVADLNYGMAPLRKAMIQAMQGWIKRYDLDGFRIDTADYVPFEFWKEAVHSVRSASRRPLFMLAEGFRADHYKAGFDITFGWPFFDGLRAIYGGASAKKLQVHVAQEAKDIPKGARRLRFTTNHDKAAWEGTTREFFKTDVGARGAFVAMAFHGGVPLIYTGQEANWQSRIPIFEHSSIDWIGEAREGRWIGQLMKLRDSNLAFREGTLVDLSTDDAIIFSKSKGRNQAVVIVNPRDREVIAPLPGLIHGVWKDGLSGKSVKVVSSIKVPAYGFLIWVRMVTK